MKAESVIDYVLKNNVDVSGLVSTRIYPVVMPQKPTYPCIHYKLIDVDRMRGVYSDPGVARARFQVTCWATTYPAVKTLAEKVRIALERYGSALTGTPIAGVTVYDIFIGSSADDYEPEMEAFAVATDFTVVHAE